MEQKQICNSSLVYDRLPPLSPNYYPWLVAQILEEKDENVNGDQIFYTVHNPMSHYRCRIPELLGRHIRGCFHGWVVLSSGDKHKWYLWNPLTSKFIRLPYLILKDGVPADINYCCLSSPPYDPDSILLFTRYLNPSIVFCRLDHKVRTNQDRKSIWIEVSYVEQLMSVINIPVPGIVLDFLLEPIWFNGKLYALTARSDYVIQFEIVVQQKEVMISPVPFVSEPEFTGSGYTTYRFLKASSEELFIIIVGFANRITDKLVDVGLYKLDMTSMVWEEMNELKDTIFLVDVGKKRSATCAHAIASESGGGYIHILHKTSKVIYSYDVKDKSISMSSMNFLDLPPRLGNLQRSHISVWTIMPEFMRLDKGDDGEAKCKSDAKQDEEGKEDRMVVRSCENDEVEEFNSKTNEIQLLDLPFHVLEMIMESCVGVEYLNFRATSKRCHLAAPVIQWSNKKARRRLQTYALSSPWLMAFEKDRGIISFTDPMFGNKYFIKASQDLFYDKRILCSRYGWLLLFIGLQRIVFFNPFTSDIRELPHVLHGHFFDFSAPPTSPDCVVVTFVEFNGSAIYLHSVGREPSWRTIPLDFGGAVFPSFAFPVFCGHDVYALSKEGGLQVFKGENLSLETVIAEAPKGCCRTWVEYYLVKCDEHLLLVIVGDFGESVEVFKLKDSTKEWEKMDGLGRHMIYICGATCLCMDAKTSEMENKIYFPRLHSKNGKMVFYSLDTCRYHTFNGRNMEERVTDIFETKEECYPQVWIEPSWSQLAKSD